MNSQDFINKIAEIIQTEEDLNINSNLSDLDEWDSLANISVVAFLDSIGKKVTADELKNIETMAELVKLAGINE